MLYIARRVGRWQVTDAALEAVTLDGHYLELGVADGKSSNYARSSCTSAARITNT